MFLTRPAALARVSHMAEQRGVHQAFRWLHLHERQIMQWQVEMVAIPAPPFGEATRAAWLADRFRDLGLTGVNIDAAGNVLATYPATQPVRPTRSVLLSAHIDTVFPPGTFIDPILDGQRLTAPGACDNAAGVVALLAMACALREGAIEVPCNLMFAGNVGEEGEGDLSGMRYLYRDPDTIAAHVVLDGAGHELVVSGAVGSRRFLVTIEGSGGHAWSDAGRPNPIVAMSQAIAHLAELPRSEETRWNAGAISGGTSINSIPQSAAARFDLRSTDLEQLVSLEVELYRAFEDAVTAANAAAIAPGARTQSSRPTQEPRPDTALRLSIQKIGDRPAGLLRPGAAILETLRAVDRHLGIATGERVASTDANIPLSLGLEAISIGAGGDGGGAHTSHEWYDARNRELGLRRILLLILALANSA